MTEPEYTQRGFRIYARLADRWGQQVRVQESSFAEEHCVWIFCNPADDGTPTGPAPHLDVAGAKAVRDGLDAFIAEEST